MDQILIGKGERPVHLLARYGNRHGLVAGATGTGKTVSLMIMAEGFSRARPWFPAAAMKLSP
jgi:hypothetical protein